MEVLGADAVVACATRTWARANAFTAEPPPAHVRVRGATPGRPREHLRTLLPPVVAAQDAMIIDDEVGTPIGPHTAAMTSAIMCESITCVPARLRRSNIAHSSE